MTVPDGIPDYADDSSTAYDRGGRPQFDDPTFALPEDEPYALAEDQPGPAEEADLSEGPSSAASFDEEADLDEAAGFGSDYENEDLIEDEAPYSPTSLEDDDEGEPVGRLVAPDLGAGVDDEDEAWGEDTGEVDELSAEESAMHITDQP
jgi:hypothetical protein